MYLVNYVCPECKEAWTNIWDSACDNDCPAEGCGTRDIQSDDYEQIKTKYPLVHSGVLPHELNIDDEGAVTCAHGKDKAPEEITYCEQCGERQAFINLAHVCLCEDCFQQTFQEHNSELLYSKPCGHPFFSEDGQLKAVCLIKSGVEHDHS